MKFCYLDESGTGGEPFAIMTGVIVDSQRMHITKKDWLSLLKSLSDYTGRQIIEFHTRDFYSGNGSWRRIDGKMRAGIISAILRWLKERKHKISFCGIDKEKYFRDVKTTEELRDIGSLWCMLGLHQLLIIQKQFQNESGSKGNTVFIFDEEVREKERIMNLALTPPEWTESYYKKRKRDEPLNQVIDVPYFCDSEKVGLLQVADLVSYVIRRYVEIREGNVSPRYYDEFDRIDEWMYLILKIALPTKSRYMKAQRGGCADLFYRYAPSSLLKL